MEKGTLTSGFIGSYGNIALKRNINVNASASFMFTQDKLIASNLSFYTEYNHKINDCINVIGNIQIMKNRRSSEDLFPNPKLRPWYSYATKKYEYFDSKKSVDQNFWTINPRIGAIYKAGKHNDVQFFGNFSKSYEPPIFNEIIGVKGGTINSSPNDLFAKELERQSAYTVEIGTKYEGIRYGWNLSMYRSWIKNELLEVKDINGVPNILNYPKTIHQGIELGVIAIPIQGVFQKSGKDQILIKSMYTYSNFYFNSGNYEGKKLAGVPPHYFTISVDYKNPGKFFLSLNAESHPSKSPVDNINTVYQPEFAVFGFRIGIEKWKNFSFYVDGKNIFNKYYASTYLIKDRAGFPPSILEKFPTLTVMNNLAIFLPAQTRAFYAGLIYKF